jgi:hypothetical protein
MATFKTVEKGKIVLIQQTDNGRIVQIGLTQAQSDILQAFLASLSKESPFVLMPSEFDLVLKIDTK